MDEATARIWESSERVLGACFEVHTRVGAGLLESVYEECLAAELRAAGVPFERQRAIDLDYRGTVIKNAYRADFVVDGRLIVEVKSVERLLSVHLSQLYTYLELTKLDIGLLVNFNVPSLRDGFKRVRRRGATTGHSHRWPP
jgi:GxxExxY protein